MSLAVHLPWLRSVARSVAYRYRSELDHDDLVQVGLIGLHQAAQAYAQHGRASLPVFAWRRVVGAMLDEMRRTDPAWRAHRAGSEAPQFVPVEDAVDLADDAATPDRLAELRDDCRVIQMLVDGLPDIERAVIVGVFERGQELAAIGRELGLTESRVSQIKTRAVERLRIRFAVAQHHGCGVVSSKAAQ